MQINLSFTSIDTKASQSCTKYRQSAIGSKQKMSIKRASNASNDSSHIANVINIFSQLPKDKAITWANQIHRLVALYAK